jgi:hypothetical protein
MDLFNKGAAPSGKFQLNLHKKPSTTTPNEGAAAISMAAHLADLAKLGIDPTKVHLTLEFKETGHIQCVSLSRGGEGIAVSSCNN